MKLIDDVKKLWKASRAEVCLIAATETVSLIAAMLALTSSGGAEQQLMNWVISAACGYACLTMAIKTNLKYQFPSISL